MLYALMNGAGRRKQINIDINNNILMKKQKQKIKLRKNYKLIFFINKNKFSSPVVLSITSFFNRSGFVI